MAEVVTFVGYQPPVRYDSIPWTTVDIQESATQDGTYVSLETQALTPLDTDPSRPAYRSFTTELGTALDYWYRIVFGDATSDTSQPTTPVQNTGAAFTFLYATIDDLARAVQVRSPTPAQQAEMERILMAVSGEINSETGRAPTDLAAWEAALATEVCLERGAEHWEQLKAPFGIMSMGEAGPVYTAKDSWDRHAHKLAPLKGEWGIA